MIKNVLKSQCYLKREPFIEVKLCTNFYMEKKIKV